MKMSDINRLSEILTWKMTQSEARAFKLCLMWEEYTQNMFPKIPCGKLPKRGDPRKSLLFRYCNKLLRETKGIILDDQYQWYIKAQLDILKNVSDNLPNISPACLVGIKAWKRWKVWLRKFQAMSKVGETKIEVPASKIFAKLQKTKEFLTKQFKGEPKLEDIEQAFKSRAFIRWVILGKIYPVYVILSPFVSSIIRNKSIEEIFNVDFNIYRSSITSEVEDSFKKLFSNEF